jgi:hypothetical protein
MSHSTFTMEDDEESILKLDFGAEQRSEHAANPDDSMQSGGAAIDPGASTVQVGIPKGAALGHQDKVISDGVSESSVFAFCKPKELFKWNENSDFSLTSQSRRALRSYLFRSWRL